MPPHLKDVFVAIKSFCTESTIHGVLYLVNFKLHPMERIFWLLIIISALTGGILASLSNWNRYLANPTVVSIEKDFRNWNNLFPAATGCLLNKVDENKAEIYILKTWGLNKNDNNYDYYLSFVEVVSNISYLNLNDFNRFKNDSNLENIDMLNLALAVHPDIDGILVTSDLKVQSTWEMILTELGVCFTMNSKYSNLIRVDLNTSKEESHLQSCHYLNGLCYARYDTESDSSINFYIHSPLDIVHSSSELPWLVGSSQEVEINYRMQETASDYNLKSLSPYQRKCRFEDEPLEENLGIFSTTFCYVSCRYKKMINLCGCAPYFYKTFNEEAKICNVSGLLCAAKFAKLIVEPPSKFGCECPQPCNIIRYLPQIPKITYWEFGYFDQRLTFRWGLLPPTTKYRRKVLFSFEDLIVSFGGAIALFLGSSFISIIEIIYCLIKYLFKLNF
nr:sodium channel protein Nach-like isoform X1 [Onthophagus taurus]XP_022905756.1 sodium channel protein Nach-like isoform X1 [Onthophagus taurus]